MKSKYFTLVLLVCLPVHDQLTITNLLPEGGLLSIYNFQGELMRRLVRSGASTLDRADLPAAPYLIEAGKSRKILIKE